MSDEHVEKPLPLKINDEITAKVAELRESIIPLGQEAITLLESIRGSGEFKRLEEIMNSIPTGHPIEIQLRSFYEGAHRVPNAISMEMPPPAPIQVPEVLPPSAFKVPESPPES